MKVKFNIIDILIVLVLIVGAIIFASLFKTSGVGGDNTANETKPYEFVIKLQNVDGGMTKDITAGLDVLDSQKNYYYGVLKDFYTEESVFLTEDTENGVFIEDTHPVNVDVYLVVEGNGYETDSDLLIEGQDIKIGKRIYTKVKGFAGLGYVTEIRGVE